MTRSHPSTATSFSEPHTRFVWTTSSAIAGTIGTTLSAIITFLLSIVFRASFDPVGADQAQILATLFQQMIFTALRDGLCVGLLLGLALALAWSSLIGGTGRSNDGWIKVTTISAVIGITLAYLGIGLGEWYYRHSLLVNALGGAIAGLIMGSAQSAVLWAHYRARLGWIIAQTLGFACIFTVMAYANREISGLLLFPLVWLAMWSLYGLFMAYMFEQIRYNYPNEYIEPD